MGTMAFGYTNHAENGTFSGGNWTLPLTNAQSRRLFVPARSADVGPATTVFDLDLGSAESIRAFSLHAHNMTAAATIEIIAADSQANLTASPTAVSGGAVLVWPAGYTPSTVRLVKAYIFWMSTAVTKRWWRVKIVDNYNPDGFVDIGYVGAWEVWVPSINYSVGKQFQTKSTTIQDSSIGLARLFSRRAPYRSEAFVLDHLTKTEADALAVIMINADKDTPILYIHDVEEPTRFPLRSYLAHFVEITPFDHPYIDRESNGIAIEEWPA